MKDLYEDKGIYASKAAAIIKTYLQLVVKTKDDQKRNKK